MYWESAFSRSPSKFNMVDSEQVCDMLYFSHHNATRKFGAKEKNKGSYRSGIDVPVAITYQYVATTCCRFWSLSRKSARVHRSIPEGKEKRDVVMRHLALIEPGYSRA
jgi:hypothetical protein